MIKKMFSYIFIFILIVCLIPIPVSAYTWTVTNIDSSTSAGAENDIVSDPMSGVHVAYLFGNAPFYLKYGHFNGINWNTEQITLIGNDYSPVSMLVDRENIYISVYNSTTSTLWLWSKIDGTWKSELIANNAQEQKLVMFPGKIIKCIFYDSTSSQIKIGTKTISGWTFETIQNVGSIINQIDACLDSYNYLHIGYINATTTMSHHLYYNGISWINNAISSTSNSIWNYLSMTITPDNTVFFIYKYNNDSFRIYNTKTLQYVPIITTILYNNDITYYNNELYVVISQGNNYRLYKYDLSLNGISAETMFSVSSSLGYRPIHVIVIDDYVYSIFYSNGGCRVARSGNFVPATWHDIFNFQYNFLIDAPEWNLIMTSTVNIIFPILHHLITVGVGIFFSIPVWQLISEIIFDFIFYIPPIPIPPLIPNIPTVKFIQYMAIFGLIFGAVSLSGTTYKIKNGDATTKGAIMGILFGILGILMFIVLI